MYAAEPLEVEHTVWPIEYKNHAAYNLRLPVVTLAETGKKVLFVIDEVLHHDQKSNMILSTPTGTTFENMVGYANKDAGQKLKEYKVVNFHEYYTSFDTTLDTTASKRFVRRLENIIADYDPDCIMFMGTAPLKALKPDLNLIKYFGRLRKMTIKGKKYKYVFTLSAYVYGTNDPKWFGIYPNLIGIGCEHIATAIRGYNLYNLQNVIDEEFKNITVVDTIEKFKLFFKELVKSKISAWDTEATSLNRINTTLLTLQVYIKHNKTTYFIPYAHKDTPFKASELQYIQRKFKYYLEFKTSTYLVFQNGQFDLCVLRSQLKIDYINHRIYDTMAGAFSLNENVKFLSKIRLDSKRLSGFSLEQLEYKYGYIRPNFAINKENRGTIANQNLKDVVEYASVDALTTFHIHTMQIKEAQRLGVMYKRFLKIVCEQIGDMILSFVECELNGTPIDKDYLFMSRARTSPINKLIEEQTEELKKSKHVRKTNEYFLQKTKTPHTGLYGGNSWIFKITKQAHRNHLFFNQMKLEPISVGKNGLGQTDKKFQAQYKEIPEVALFIKYQGSTKLRNTYINGIWKTLIKDEDARTDGRFRARYNFTGILTGRAGASNGLHQIPSRGNLAKYIKRQFVASIGCILIEKDYSAHEVRLWGNVANDEVLCDTFRRGLRARQKLRILNPTASLKIIQKLKRDIEKEGDIHSLNYYLFFKRLPKNKSERNSVKALIFGTIYGIGKKKLGTDLKNADMDEINEKIKAKRREISDLNLQLAA